ncbi:MAG: MAC/perforin domain-containing protein [Prochloraceae cyanobacterium]
MGQILTGIEYLGCTYDIYGYYARGSSVNTSQQLFSFPDADTEIEIYDTGSGDGTYLYPKSAITVARLYEADQKTSTCESTEDIYTELSVSANLSGSYGLFSAEVSAKYSQSYTSSSYFYHVEESGYAYSYRLTLKLDDMLENLDEDFKNDLYNMDADELVETYGTHFVYEAVFGGRWTYSQSVSKFSYSTSTEAQATVQANYASYSGSVSASNQTDYSQSNSQSNGEFWCIGGTPGNLVDGFDAWAESVPGNFALVDFTSNSLKRISELVENNDDRKDEIDAAIQAVLDAGTNPNTTALTNGNYEIWAKNDNYNTELEMEPQDGYVVVGFGGDVKDGNFSRIAVRLLNLSTSEREWRVFGDQETFNQNEYETLGEVPDGCVLTGIGLSGHKNDFKSMVLYYQELTPTSSTNNYLDTEVQSKAFNRQQEATSPNSSYESDFQPDGSEGKAIVGIGVGYSGGKKGKIDRLKLYRAPLEEDDSSTTTTLTWSDYEDQEVKTGGSSEQTYKANEGYAIVGFGGRIKKQGKNGKKSKFSRIAVCVVNLATNERKWEVQGDRTTFNAGDYERIGEIPEGCVLTGIGLREKDHNLKNMVLYYQQIDTANADNNYLNGEVQTTYLGDKLSSYEAEYKPNEDNNMAIIGIEVSTGKSSIDYLKLNQAKLEASA